MEITPPVLKFLQIPIGPIRPIHPSIRPPVRPSARVRPRPSASVRVHPRLIDELITYILHLGNDDATVGQIISQIRPHPSASVRPVRTHPSGSVATCPWPVRRPFRTSLTCNLFQTQSHSIDPVGLRSQMLW
eukprot:1343789-Prymnesium_polylepis.1